VEVKVLNTSDELGKTAAMHAAEVLHTAIKEHGRARLMLSTWAVDAGLLNRLYR